MQLKAFCATLPRFDGVENPTLLFDSIKAKYNSLRKQGKYTTLPAPSLYIHQISKVNKTYLGLVACVDLSEYLNGNILPHEKTINSLEEKQVRLLTRTNAQLKPLMLAHRKTAGLQEILAEGVARYRHFLEVPFEDLGEVHRYWQIPQGEVEQQILQLYKTSVSKVYVADGHHRLAANVRFYEQSGGKHRWLVAALYEEDQLQIFEFNRIVKGLNGMSPLEFLARVSRFADIEPLPKAAKPSKAGELTMFLQGEWFRLTWKAFDEGKEKSSLHLDADRLNSLILEGVLGISDIRSAKRVEYLQGTIPLSQILENEHWNKNKVLFCLNPIDLNTFFEISDRRLTLPPKSTWFEPRIRSGVLVRELKELTT